MSANNLVIIIGRVGNDPEMKYLDSGKVTTGIRVAVKRPVKSPTDQDTDWFSCDFWGKQAELAGELIKKGSLISVIGSARIDQWEAPDGTRRSKFRILGDSFQLLESKARVEERQTQEQKGVVETLTPPPIDDFEISNDEFIIDEDEPPPF